MARNISTRLTAAPVGDANGYLASTNMKVGAYTLIANAPPSGARHVTVTRTVVVGADTPGTIVLVGKDLSGQVITETISVGAHSIVVASSLWFSYLTSATGAGWVISGTADTVEIGWGAECAVATGSGELKALFLSITHASHHHAQRRDGHPPVVPDDRSPLASTSWSWVTAGSSRLPPAGRRTSSSSTPRVTRDGLLDVRQARHQVRPLSCPATGL